MLQSTLKNHTKIEGKTWKSLEFCLWKSLATLIFKNYKCFPISREKNNQYILTNFRHCSYRGSNFSVRLFQKIFRNCMFSFFETINYQYIWTNFRNCSYRGSNFSVQLFQKIFKNYKCFPFLREKTTYVFPFQENFTKLKEQKFIL